MRLRTTRSPATLAVRPPGPRALALTLAAVAALGTGCNAAHPTTSAAASASPTATASTVDDSTASVVGPSGSATELPEPSTPAPPAPVAGSPGAGAGTTGGGGAQAGPQAASRGSGRTTPGIPDGATALSPTATVAPDTRCTSAALRLEPVDLQGSPGGTYANFRLLNTGRTSCTLKGFVGATLIGDDGKDIATAVRHEAGPDVWVSIAPRGSAQFHLRFPNPYAGDAPCNPPNAARVRVTLATLRGTLTGSTPEGGIQACNGAVSTAPVGST